MRHLLPLFVLACNPAAEPVPPAADRPLDADEVRFETRVGAFVIEVDREAAPATAANFLELVDSGFYDGRDGAGATLVHRVVPGFVVQLGGFVEGLVPKPSERQVPYEGDNGRSNLRGTVGMARLDDPDSASTQFYVNLGDNGSLDHRDPRAGYAVFGEVVEGLPVLHALATAEIDKSAAMPSVPARDIVVDEALRGSVGAPPDTGTAFP